MFITAPRKSFSSQRRFVGLGVTPIVATSVIGGTAALAALAALINNALDDDWTDNNVFQTNMRKIHSAMLSLQCILGGAQPSSPLVDSLGNTVCHGGTKPLCTITGSQLTAWRTLRDGFSMFWSDSQSFGSFVGPSDAEAKQAKQFARDFFSFYNSLKKTCAKQGASLTDLPAPEEESNPSDWMKYGVWGLGALAVIALAVSAKSIFGKG